MNYLGSIVDHPVALIIALIVSGPFIWVLTRMFFKDIAADAEESALCFLINALPGPDFLAWPLVKLILILFFSAALITLFYRVFAGVAAILTT